MAVKRVFERFGQYFLFDLIAEGGMAEIFRARRVFKTGDGRLYIIKRIRPDIAAKPGFREMFQSEARVLLRLTHPNIVQLHDIEEENGMPFLVMEYLQGRTLGQMLRALKKMNFEMPLEFVIAVAEQTARGLAHAHGLKDQVSGDWLKVVHRDITPENIFLCFDGSVKLIDFGIVKATTNVEPTKTDFLKGNPAYLSPEYLSGNIIDGRSDVFSLGAVIWEMVSGKALFLGPNDLVTVKNVADLIPAPLVSFNPSAPPELEDIVTKALEKDPMHRYRTAEELERQLHSLLARIAGQFVPADVGTWMKKLFRADIEADALRLQELDEEFRHRNEGSQSAPLISVAPPMNAKRTESDPDLPPLPAPEGEKSRVVAPNPSFQLATTPKTPAAIPSTPPLFPMPAPDPTKATSTSAAPEPEEPPKPMQLTRNMLDFIENADTAKTRMSAPPSPMEPPIVLMPTRRQAHAQAQAQPRKKSRPPGWGDRISTMAMLVVIGVLVLWAHQTGKLPASPRFVANFGEVVRQWLHMQTAPVPVTPPAPAAIPQAVAPPPAQAAPVTRHRPQPAPRRTAAPLKKARVVARPAPTRTATPAPKKKRTIPLRIRVLPEGSTYMLSINGTLVDHGKKEFPVVLDEPVRITVVSPGYKPFQLTVLPDSQTLRNSRYWQFTVRLQQK